MRHFLSHKGLVAALVAALLLFPMTSTRADMPPNLSPLELLSKINDNKGRVVIVNFFASWCTPCLAEIPGLINLRQEFNPDDVVILGLSVDQNMGDISEFVTETPFNYPVYVVGEDVAAIFKVNSIPRLVIYDQSGRMVVDHEGVVNEDDLRQILNAMLEQ